MKQTFIFFGLLLLGFQKLSAQTLAQDRANSLKKGVNLTYFEAYWNGDPALRYKNYLNVSQLPAKKNNIQKMAAAGFDNVRVPICFDVWTSQNPPYSLYDSPTYFSAVDSVVKYALANNLKVIIDFHHGQLSNGTMGREVPRIKALWMEIATRYKNTDPNKVFFEIYNEPNDISVANWQTAAEQFVQVIRVITPNHSIIVGANEWNSTNALANNTLTKLSDDNIIYTFHFYDPFIFTHQGAEWTGDPTSTTGIKFPYAAGTMPPINPKAAATWAQGAYNNYVNDGTKASLKNTVQQVKNWATQRGVPIYAGEFGAYGNFSDQTSRCNLATADIEIFGELGIPWSWWEWDEGFSMLQGNKADGILDPCFKNVMNRFNSVVTPCSNCIDIRVIKR